MAELLSGKTEQLPYSLSRWTDLPAAKWPWFQTQLDQGWMVGFDPRTAVPCRWSLAPEDTFGLIFWTKDPTNLVVNAERLKDYPLVIHMTLTGWEEVERGAPRLHEGLALMSDAVNAFGPERVTWRFSPVPAVADVVDRFATIANHAAFLGIKEVYLAFLQENDLLPETRPRRYRQELLRRMAHQARNLDLLLCREDMTLIENHAEFRDHRPSNLKKGVCEPGHRFNPREAGSDGHWRGNPATEGCGCALSVDPFTFNESCSMGCAYCYAADKSLSPHKHNTTKLRVIR